MVDGGGSVGAEDGRDGVLPVRARLSAIEKTPLVDRATGFAAVHDELLRELESGDAPRDA